MRDEIYQRISKERYEQDKQWGGPKHDNEHSILDWVAYIDTQLKKLLHCPYEEESRLIKVAALAVAALEVMEREKIRESLTNG